MISAEKLLMLGVGAIGLYAVYRLTSAPRDQGPLLPEPAPSPPGPSPTTTSLPREPGSIGSPPEGLPLVATAATPTLRLANSRAYRGRLEVAPGTPDNLVRSIIRSMGFDYDAIQIFSTSEQAAPHVPAFALANPGQGTRWFHGRYLESTRDLPRPRELVALWIVSGPPARDLISGVRRLPQPFVPAWDPRRSRWTVLP